MAPPQPTDADLAAEAAAKPTLWALTERLCREPFRFRTDEVPQVPVIKAGVTGQFTGCPVQL
jgi:hypothetical protein